jgi:hypothetical protein
MKLDLSHKEKEIMVSLLEYYIPVLRTEIASGVKHNWRIALHQEEDVLKEILERLKNLN